MAPRRRRMQGGSLPQIRVLSERAPWPVRARDAVTEFRPLAADSAALIAGLLPLVIVVALMTMLLVGAGYADAP